MLDVTKFLFFLVPHWMCYFTIAYILHFSCFSSDQSNEIFKFTYSVYLSIYLSIYIYIYIYKHESKSPFPGWRHRLLRQCSRCTAKRHISPQPHLFIIRLDYVLRTSIDEMKENGFKLTKERNKRYPEQTITDTDYADDIALLANALAQAETLLHSLEQGAAGIGLHVNTHKTEHMCFNKTDATLNGSSLKLADKFTYLRSSVSSTEREINMQLAKAYITVDRLSVIWNSYLTDKIKCSGRIDTAIWVQELDGTYTRMLRAILNKSWRQHSTKQ